MINQHADIAILIARIFLGMLFFRQGYDKVINVKVANVIENFELPLLHNYFPRFFLVVTAYFTSYVELIGGLLLIFGLCKYYILYLLGIDLLMVSLAFSLFKPMWDLQHVFPRLALLIFLLVAPASWDTLSLDCIFKLFPCS